MAQIRQIVEKAHAERKEKKILVRQPLTLYKTTAQKTTNDLEIYVREEINVKNVVWGAKKDELDTEITPELEEEAKARELIRKIQEERKNLGMNLTQKASVSNPWVPTDTKLVQRVKSKTLTASLTKGEFKVAPF